MDAAHHSEIRQIDTFSARPTRRQEPARNIQDGAAVEQGLLGLGESATCGQTRDEAESCPIRTQRQGSADETGL
jgi:hypothetical protein